MKIYHTEDLSDTAYAVPQKNENCQYCSAGTAMTESTESKEDTEVKEGRSNKESVRAENEAYCVRKGVSYLRLQSRGTVPPFQFLERSLRIFHDTHIPIYLMTSSSTNLSLTTEMTEETFLSVGKELSEFAEWTVEHHVAILRIPESLAQKEEHIGTDISRLLHQLPILMISYGSDNRNLLVALRESDCEKAIRILTEACPLKENGNFPQYN
ncbi:hypothetical protein [Phocaeicola faecicola]|jgi:aspartokinase|uniref:hypothetical protein n=1 Tax=Phocaeicola faecicola TaxID=2739389 RepID=UPI0015E71E28|nr:hypothetical protein [Phocaeicola faecicola]